MVSITTHQSSRGLRRRPGSPCWGRNRSASAAVGSDSEAWRSPAANTPHGVTPLGEKTPSCFVMQNNYNHGKTNKNQQELLLVTRHIFSSASGYMRVKLTLFNIIPDGIIFSPCIIYMRTLQEASGCPLSCFVPWWLRLVDMFKFACYHHPRRRTSTPSRRTSFRERSQIHVSPLTVPDIPQSSTIGHILPPGRPACKVCLPQSCPRPAGGQTTAAGTAHQQSRRSWSQTTQIIRDRRAMRWNGWVYEWVPRLEMTNGTHCRTHRFCRDRI